MLLYFNLSILKVQITNLSDMFYLLKSFSQNANVSLILTGSVKIILQGM